MLWAWFEFSSLKGWAPNLVASFHFGDLLGVCYHARTVSALEASSDKLSYILSDGTCLSSHQIFLKT